MKADILSEQGVEETKHVDVQQGGVEAEHNVDVQQGGVEAEQQSKKRGREQPEDTSDQPGPSKRKRKPSLKVREQQEADELYAHMREKATTFDENGDIDDPTILEVRISINFTEFTCILERFPSILVNFT